jgi:hypothetical protein
MLDIHTNYINTLIIIHDALSLLISEFNVNDNTNCSPIINQFINDENVRLICGIYDEECANINNVINIFNSNLSIKDFINFVENIIRIEC